MDRAGTLENYEKVYWMLGDEQSRTIYLNRINWLISGDLKYWNNIINAYLPQFPDRPKLVQTAIQNIKMSLPPDRGVVFYGAGRFAPTVLSCWGEDERLVGFCSQTKSKQKNGYCGYPVMSPEELLTRNDLSVVLSVILNATKNEIKRILCEGKYPADQVYEIPRVPVTVDAGQYFEPDLISLGENEVFIDAGCYDLGTSLEFKQRCNHVKKIYAFEPDPNCYQNCLMRKAEEAFTEVEIFPFGTWSKRAVLSFSAAGDQESCVSKNGEVNISAVPIDEVVNPADRVTMIKMDVEGSELEALKGARKIIQRDRPKLAICIYHKPEDMTEIPLYIKELVPEYKLYIRHYSNSENETVLYAVMS